MIKGEVGNADVIRTEQIWVVDRHLSGWCGLKKEKQLMIQIKAHHVTNCGVVEWKGRL